MAKVSIKGIEYGLRFDLDAMEQAEEAFGGIKQMFEVMNGGTNQIRTIKTMFMICANCYRSYKGMEESVDESVLKHLPLSAMNDISVAIKKAMDEGMHTETMNGGEADDDVHDAYLEEIEREEKKE